ncbi:MAG: histidine phosphatase family protein [Prevotellaceae bacterium]|nr:histidine phosphatase family protein [Prevotellaceae bacterium]
MTKLYLLRHGETIDNVNRIMQGQTQGELTENGRKQAHEVAKKMADTEIDVFISSDLKRSYDTCAIIAEPHGKEVVTTPLLRERDWGSFTGRYIPDLKDVKPWPKDIESIDTLKARAKEFLNLIRKSYPNKTVLAVGHGIINKAIQAVYFKKEMKDITRMENAEVRELIL